MCEESVSFECQYRHTVTLCGNCLRITVGTKMENETLLEALRKYGV